jgi:hypothetical protein
MKINLKVNFKNGNKHLIVQEQNKFQTMARDENDYFVIEI